MRLIDADMLLKSIEELQKSPWYKHGREIDANPMETAEYMSRKDAFLTIRDLCIFRAPTVVSQEDIEVLKIIKDHFQVCFDEDSDNGLDTIVFNGFSLDGLWEDGYDDEFEKVKNWLWKG